MAPVRRHAQVPGFVAAGIPPSRGRCYTDPHRPLRRAGEMQSDGR
jgi:hypothetical protein